MMRTIKRRANHFYHSFHVETLKRADVAIIASVVMNNGEEVTPEVVPETPEVVAEEIARTVEVLKVIPQVTS